MSRPARTRYDLLVLLLWLLASAASLPAVAQRPQPPEAPPDARQSEEGALRDQGDPQQGDTSVGQPAEQPPRRTVDLSSPRATMRSFLVAVQEATGDHPERIDDAVRCLDTSELAEGERLERSRQLARRLHAIIDKKGVNLDDLPEETDQPSYFFYNAEPKEGVASIPQIALSRDSETGLWLFTSATLEAIPKLEETVAAQADAATPAQSAVPASRRSPRATMTTFLEAMNAQPRDMKEAVLCLDPAGQDREAWSTRSEELATQLKTVMDKIELVVLSEIPDVPDGAPYVWYTSETGNIVIDRIEEEAAETAGWRFAPRKGEWRFTPKTLKTLNALYAQLEQSEIIPELQEAGVREELTLGLKLQRWMPQWLRTELWHLQGWQWFALAALLPLGWVIQVLASAVVGLALRTWLKHKGIDLDHDAQRRVVRSSGAVVTVLFWYFAIQYLRLPEALLGVLLRGTKLGIGVTGVWLGYRCVDIVGGHIAADKEVQLTRFDDVLIPLLSKILRLFVVLVAILIVCDWIGWRPTTVLGALGIGGLAVAFAAKDTLGNFFGSITVLFDRPFGIDDWIVIGDVEGMVERVGFRSTRVRTFYNSIVTIPNSLIVNTQVDNYGVRRYRRAKIMLSVTYSTPPEKIDAFCEGIRELIRLHPYTRKDYYHVYFNKFAASSLDILLYVFFEVPDWGTELRERHQLFLDILRLARKLGVDFAFPTQTVWLQRTRDGASVEDQAAIAEETDPSSIGLEKAAHVFEEVYGPKPARRAPVVIDTTPRSKRRPSPGGDEDARGA